MFAKEREKSPGNLEKCVLTIQELMSLKDDDMRLKAINKDEILHLYLNSDGSVDYVQKILRIYKFDKLSNEDWKKILQRLTSWHDENPEKSSTTDYLEKTINFIRWLQESTTGNILSTTDLSVISFILDFVFSTSYKRFISCNQTNATNDHLMGNVLTLHDLGLKLLSAALINKVIVSKEEFYLLINLICKLCDIAEQKPTIALKYLIETVKALAKLTSRCIKWCSASQKDLTSNSSAYRWGVRPLECLILQVDRSLKIFHRKETLKMSVAEIDRFLRVVNFYIKLLKNLISDFADISIPIPSGFLRVWLRALALQNRFQDVRKGLLDKYVNEELIEVFKLIYRQQDIANELLWRLEQKIELEHCYAISVEFLKNLIRDDTTSLPEERSNVLEKMFELLFNSSDLLERPTMFNKLINYFTLTTMLFGKTDYFRSYHNRNILEGDLSLAFASAEIFLCYQSYYKDNSVFLLNEFRYWRRCHSDAPLNSKEMIIRRLLRNCYELCIAHRDIKKEDLWNFYNENKINRQTCKFFFAIGLHNLPNANENASLIYTRIIEQFNTLVHECKSNSFDDVHHYNTMAIYIEILASSDKRPKKDLSVSLINLMTETLKNNSQSILIYDKLLLAICKFFTIFSDQSTTKTIESFYDHLLQFSGDKNNLAKRHWLHLIKTLLHEAKTKQYTASQQSIRFLYDFELFSIKEAICMESNLPDLEESIEASQNSNCNKRRRLNNA